MIQFSLSLSGDMIRNLRRIADSEIDNEPFEVTSQYHSMVMALTRRGLVECVKTGRRSARGVDTSTVKLSNLGVAVLQLVDIELETLRRSN